MENCEPSADRDCSCKPSFRSDNAVGVVELKERLSESFAEAFCFFL